MPPELEAIDPTLHVILSRGTERREYAITASTKFDAWPFWVDRGSMPEFGVITGPEAVLARKALYEGEIVQLVKDGWTVS